MSPLMTGRATRYLVLSIALFTSFWLWRHSFTSQSPSGPQVSLPFIPAKLYEPTATVCTDNLAQEAQTISL